MRIQPIPTCSYARQTTRREKAQSPEAPRDSLSIRHDALNDTLMGAGAAALFGGMILRTVDPKIGALVAASAGLFVGAALLR